jgi:threonine aldolase
MRQAGVIAAAGLYALDHHLDRMAEDHANAREIGTRLSGQKGVSLDLQTVQSNIVIFRTEPPAPDAQTIVARARDKGVLVSAFAQRTVRATTHLNVSRADCIRAAEVLAEVTNG